MSDFEATKYKDNGPKETIEQIKNILKSNSIFTKETEWFNQCNDYYSLRLEVCNPENHESLEIGVNGKGTNEDFARASAYAELLERIQNSALFLNEFSPEDKFHSGFYSSRDEIYVSNNDILGKSIDHDHEYILPEMTQAELEKFLTDSHFLTPTGCPNEQIAIPYYSVSDSKICYFPINLLKNCFTTTGMCAGNTREEALVQGLGEIFERYSMAQIESEEITPPSIPIEYIEKEMPRIIKMIRTLEDASPHFKVIIKDCSLGKNIPTIAAITIIPDTGRYWVTFGSAPVLEIAIERCLTEFMQGVPLTERKNCFRSEYSFFEEFDTNDMYNHSENLVSATGYFPNHLFSDNFSYSFNPEIWVKNASNSEMLNRITGFISELGFNIFIRDNSFLNFPTFSIIIPGMSQTHFDNPGSVFTHLISNDAKYYAAKEIACNLKEASIEQLQSFNDFLADRFMSFRIADLFENIIPQESIVEEFKIPTSFTEALIFFRLEDYKSAYYVIDESIGHLSETMTDQTQTDLSFYKCARDYMGALSEELNIDSIQAHLQLFYSKKIIDRVLVEFKDPKQILNRFPQYNCFKCSACELNATCNYKTVSDIYRNIKIQSSVNFIDQKTNSSIFDTQRRNRQVRNSDDLK